VRGGRRRRSPDGSPEKPKKRYGALNNKRKALKQRGEGVDFTEPLEGEEEAAAERIGGEARSSGGLPWGRQCRGGDELEGAVRGGEELGGGLL
jgi:hypothetical protein